MGKQDIVQVLLVDSSVKVVFLEEGANALDLIHLVLQEIRGDESLEMDTTSWKVILISMEDNTGCLEVLSKQDSNELLLEEEIVDGNTRYLQNQEKIFPILEKVKLQAVKAEGLSSQSVQDIHDLSQYLHKPCFKIVDTKLTIKLQIQKGTDNQDIIDMEFYIDEHMSFNNLIKIVDESLSTRSGEVNLELAREISLIKINSEENKETIIVNLEDTIYNLMTNLNLDIENNILLDYKFHYGLPENWYTKMGSMTSKLTKNLARPLSVYTFFGGNNNSEKKTAEATRHENLIKRRIASPSRMVRHMSLSGKDSETGIDLSTITTWISGDVGKLRRQTDLDNNNNSMDWANTYPITRGLKQRERLPTTEESEIQSEIQEDVNQEQLELEDELNELDKAFLEVLDELNIKDAIREKMMEFPASKKLELIEQNEMVRKMKSPNSATSPPQPMSMTRPNSIVSINTINSNNNDNSSSAAQASLESILTTERPTTTTTTPATSGISNFIFGSLFSNNSNCVPGSTDYYLKFLSSKNLSSNETFKLLQSLRIHLSTAAVTWVRSFLEDGTALLGIETLLMKYIEKNISIVDQSNSIKIQDIDEDIHLECIRCLRVLLNTESGFHEVLKHPEIVKYLTFSINTQNDKIRKISTEVLAAICVLSKQGHMQILDSLADFRLKFHEDYRFQYLLHSLEAHVSLEGISAIAAYEYKTTCLSFINALVNTPESLDERMLLREEFHRRGLKVVFQELRESYPPESLVKQIECYEEELEADKNELKEQILIQTLDDDKNHPLLKLSNNIKQLSGESVLRTIINEIISHLSNLLNNEYQDELRYEICNLIDMFCHHMLNLKDIEDYNSSLLPFFEEAKEFVGLNIRDVLELSEEFQLEMQGYKKYEQELKDTKEKLENSELELKELKEIAIINYFIEQKNKGSEDIDFSKSPKDNFTTLVQKLIQKEKEISKLNERIDRLANIKGNNSLLESSKLPEFSRSAIKDELDLQKQQNKELTSNLDSKQKEIAYLKRSLEAVCAKFQLKINEYVPENNNNNFNDTKNNSMEINNGITDLLSVTDVQILQAELEEAREKLAVKEDLENRANELQASISRLELQVDEQNNKLKEKEIEIQNWKKSNNILEESNINDNNLIPTKAIPLPPPPPPLPQFTNTSQSKLNSTNSNIIPLNIPPPPPLPPNNNKIPPPPPLLSPPIFNKSTGSLPPPPPPPLPLTSNHKVTKSTLLPPPPPPPMSSILQKLTEDNTKILPTGIPPPPPNGTGENLLGISSQSQKNIAIKPKVPMKALFWKKIGNGRVRDTIWENMELDKIYKKMDFEEIELLFCKKITKKPGSGYSSIGRKLKGKKSITLLDFNRANNIAIALARMKMPFPAIRLAILEINDTRLSIDNLRSLENIAPTQDEIKIVKSYNGTIETLGTAEKYMLQILDIPRLSERLNCMIFRRKFDSDLQDIKPELTTLNQVIIELKTSKRLSILLEIILSLGNYLNANTPRGEAKGFKLEALRLLKDVKANTTTSNRPITSFLHYICQMLEDHWKDILKLKEDFKTIEAAARISVATLANNIYSLTQGVKRIETEIQQHKKLILKPENDRFIEVMEKFIASGSSISKSIKENGEKLESNLEELLTYFGEDSSSTKPEDFFNLIISFLDALELAHNENIKLRAKKVNKLVNHQAKISNQDTKSIGFGQGDFDVAIRELRSGLRRKRGDRPKSNLFNLPGFGKIPTMDTNESTTTNTITN
ncbi:FH2-domain-containing protein [Neoconidiobolus thromboides FSU 785]|nr:FH2-domain-containing protein [Neoconidiobolus thromboides FSU 785]